MKFSNVKLTAPYLKLSPLFYDEVNPSALKKPFLISGSQSAAELLGVDEDLLHDEKLLEILNGSLKLEGSKTFAMCYAGHQFGDFTARLGDGRVINLGQVKGQNLQLKGSGLTLYSRLGDGRATLDSSIREYLMSEAMHALEIPTSRAMALIGSDTDLVRERREKAAIVLRLSPSWIRFGSFEYFTANREFEKIKELANYVIEESFPHLLGVEECYLKMYEEIVKSTAKTLAGWMSVGFNHGVMNTDNMAIDGRTIDYGPFAFLDDYEPHYVCNKTDETGRYSFKNQPTMARWNLEKLALAISSIVDYEDCLEILDNLYYKTYEDEFLKRMRRRLGLFTNDEEDRNLVRSMLRSLSSASIDYNLFFRKLSRYDGNKNLVLNIALSPLALEEWLESYDNRLVKETLSQEQRHKKMLAINPKYILKNHILQEAIDQAKKHDFTILNHLLRVALNPCDEHKDLEYLCEPTPSSVKNIKLSCSS